MGKTKVQPHWYEYIAANRFDMTQAAMGKVLGVNKSCVGRFMKLHNLSIPASLSRQMAANSLRNKTSFTQKEDAYIRQHYQTTSMKGIARVLGRSNGGVRLRMERMGLYLSDAEIEKRQQNSRFKKGHSTFNKGKKWDDYMPPLSVEKIKNAGYLYEKGHKPHNTYMNHFIVKQRFHKKDGYARNYLKINDGNWVLLRRYIWEQRNGPVPAGHVIATKDGNPLNDTIENLELVSRKEWVLRHSIHRYPEEMKTTFKILGKINKKIKNYDTNHSRP